MSGEGPRVRLRDTMRLAPVLWLAVLGGCAASPRPLKVCADPNNMPFSDAKARGFENQVAGLVARDLGRPVAWVWWPQWRGYVRKTLKAGRCDLWPGVASQLQMLDTTRPYYRSTYVFLTRADRRLDVRSFDDPRLKRLRIAVQMIGDDAANTPPAFALARRGVVRNVRGFMVYDRPSGRAPIVDAVAGSDVDVAIVWGPLAGYFASISKVPLKLEPVQPWPDGPGLPMAFDVSMGVRKGDTRLRQAIDQSLERRRGEIRSILARYGVPAAPA